MSIEVTDLVAELDVDDVQQQQEELAVLMQEANPTIDPRRGVLHDLLFYNEAVYASKNRKELERLKASQSLLAITEDPAIADADTVDAVLSNFRITRKDGSQATGEMTIVVDTLEALIIAEGSLWSANGAQFAATAAFSAVTGNANVTSANDRVLNPVGDGTYTFTIFVQAVEPGTTGLLVKDTLLVPSIAPRNFVRAYAASDFTGGRADETNAELLARLLEGVACKALSGSVSMNAALRDVEAFADVLATSIIGFGDEEMLRDQHSIFPGSLGGRIDWYVRSQEQAQRIGLTKTATLVDKQPDGSSTWQFGIERDDAPGFYDVVDVQPQDAANTVNLPVSRDTRSLDMTPLDNDGFLPDLADVAEGVFSRFQAAVIQFTATGEELDVSAIAEGDTLDFDVTLRAMPLISDIQDWASDRSVRNRAGDALIKAPIPCFVGVSFTIGQPPGYPTLDTDPIRSDVAELINRWGFTGKLPASAIANVVHNYLTGNAYIGAIDMLAEIRFPTGELRQLHTTETLEVPDEPSSMVTARTVAFLTTPDDIAISVVTLDVPEV
jgi:hypothetical protein